MRVKSEPAPTPWQALIEAGSKCGTEGIVNRISKYSQLKKRSLKFRDHISDTLESYDSDKKKQLVIANKRLSECGLYLQFRHYYTIDELRLIKTHTCKQFLLCPLCAARRASVYLHQYIKKYAVVASTREGLSYSLVTLTVRHTKHDTLIHTFGKLKDAWKLAHQRIRDSKRGRSSSEFGKIEGWVGAYEVTNKRRNGFHPHIHILVLHYGKLSQSAIKKEWEYITGDSTQVDVSGCKNPDNPVKDFLEVFKYTLKFSAMKPEDVVETYMTLKGRRMLFSGGLFRGVKIPDEVLDQPLENLPYLEIVYQYMMGKGYQPVHTKLDAEHSEYGYSEIQKEPVPISYDDLLSYPDLMPFASEEIQDIYNRRQNNSKGTLYSLNLTLPGTSSLWFETIVRE